MSTMLVDDCLNDRPSAQPRAMAASNKGSRRQTLALLLTAVLAGKLNGAVAETGETCAGEFFRASCANNEVIVVTSAEYGRKEVGRCITETDDFMGCTNDVLPLLDRWCSGRRECDFQVTNPDLDRHNSECLKILRMYLKTTYSCIEISTECSASGRNAISGGNGIISSYITRQKRCGLLQSPWVISARVGQTVNMTMLDFSVEPDSQPNIVKCKHVYGFILERALGINHTICGGKNREEALYTSKTNSLEVVLTNIFQSHNFIINFQAVGCPDVNPPERAWYKREGSEAVIGCETNDQEWRLTCTGNTWDGVVGNCSSFSKSGVVYEDKNREEYDETEVEFPSVVLLTAIAGGAVILVVIVIVIGVVYIKKYRMKQETHQMQQTYATVDRNTLAYYRPVGVDPSTNQQPPPSWDAPLTDKEAGTLTSYPAQCSCATLKSHDNQSIFDGGSVGKQHLYSSINTQ